MKKQTAVEWMVDILERYIQNLSQDDLENLSNLFDQAKQMEKEQIIKSYLDGDSNGCGCYDWSTEEQAEDYYKETYKEIK
jgi:HEPN domain-containing protein